MLFQSSGGPSVCVNAARLPRPSPDPRAHKDVERFSFHKGHQHCLQLICLQRHHNFSCCVRFCHRCRFSFHGTRQDFSRSRVYAHNEVLCASLPKTRIRFPCSSAVEAFPALSCPPRLDWLLLDLLRLALPHPLFAQGTAASVTRLGTKPCC